MTPENWKLVEERLTHLYYPVLLNCDGYKVTLMLKRINQFNNGIFIYVNGVFKGEWLINDCEERRRFLRPVSQSLFSAKQKKSLQKMSKRLRKKIGLPDPESKYVYYHYYWKSFRSLKKHLINNNNSIELARE